MMNSAASDFKGLTRSHQPNSSSNNGNQTPTKSSFGGLYDDPRTSSTQSLTPSLPEYEEIERRKLLVIYIHGFMGNDTSFQSFPAHVHRYLKLALSDSHVVHSKIYPRYKTYKSIDVARDNFSTWLEPLESPKIDIVLIGHSMGGLLAADVVLKPPAYQQQQHHGYFKHRIIGTVNLDSPLLGMHPGIIVSGISSLFRKTETPRIPGESPAESTLSPSATGLPSPNPSTYSVPSTMSEALPSPPPPPAPFVRPALTYDPNFNPNLANDIRIEERTWWKNVVHFVKKHNSEGLIDAAANHIMSHMEFGGSMFDINSLKSRYENIRKLEDVDDLKQVGFSHVPPQVRFIQYYTICNGYPKKKKEEDPKGDDAHSAPAHDNSEKFPSPSHIPVDDHGIESRKEIFGQDLTPLSVPNSERSSLELLSPEPMPDEPPSVAGDSSVETTTTATANLTANDTLLDDFQPGEHNDITSPTGEFPVEDKVLMAGITHDVAALDLDLPAVPELPPKPNPPNLEDYNDKDARKLAEKEAKRVQKVYTQAVKDREREAEKKAKEEKKRRKKEEAAAAAVVASPAIPAEPEASPPISTQEASEKDPAPSGPALQPTAPEWTPISPDLPPEGKPMKKAKEKSKDREKEKGKEEKKKQRRFCNVPKSQGQIDPKWVSVFMKDMDEVAAHTGLFFAGEHYERLVGDVGNTIVEWVHADMTKRTILGLQ
ncbi:hypothetical protein O1611_g5157 [Lasiodiplodia mahajangana]|uniref:Uncharacterized protein n=1 Tax=Lasiodiplodia mahajangana TaxID=1108764 RepID=A0ACC2JM95_9PEZI|nr:hypothetical protein O1611_g5157 [Lasiodiplodia mahajangana]